MLRGVITAAFIFAATAAAQAENVSVRTFHVGNWEVEAFADSATGKISGCIAEGSYRSGISMALGVSALTDDWSMGFGDPRWRFRPGEQITIRYAVDNGPIRTANAVAGSPTYVHVTLPEEVSLFQEMRKGHVLRVHGGGDVLEFNLTGTSRLLIALVECAAPPKPAVSAAAPSFKAPSAAPQSQSAEFQVEAMAVATDVLQAAGFKDYRFLRGQDVPESMRSYDAVWEMPGGDGTLDIVPDPSVKFDDIKTFLISSDAGGCKGSFASGSKPATETEAATVFTACEDNGAKLQFSYFVVDRKDGGYYVFSLGQGQENRPFDSSVPDAETATQTLRQATFKVTQ